MSTSGPLARYAAAVAGAALALALRLALAPVLGSGAPFLTFFPAVAVVAILGGLGPGLLATALSALVAASWMRSAAPGAVLGTPAAAGLAVFTVMSVAISFAAGLHRSFRSRLAEQERHIAERRRVEKALRRHELVVQQSRDIILFMRREDGRILEANPAATEAYGYTRDELLARSIHDLRPAETRASIQSQMSQAGAGGVLFESLHRRKDGSTFHVEVSSRGVEVDGTLTLVSVVRDITDRKRAEDALRRSEAQLRTLFDTMNEGFALHEIVCDAAGKPCDVRHLFVNPAFERHTGRKAEEFVGRTVRELFPGMEGPWLDRYAKVALTGEPARFQAQVGPPGKWFEVSAYQTEPGRFAAVFFDVSDRKLAEEALREADRRKDEFLGMLSHELRNPLAPIRNSTYILGHAEPGSPQARRAQGVIERQTGHLTRLVDDLLDVTRIARGKIELQRGRIDAREVVRRACDDHQTLFRDRHLELRIEISEPVWIEADETRIAQVVGNLLQNAAKFSHDGGTILATVATSGGHAEIRVRDDGIGITPDLLPQVFEPFVQAEGGLARTKGGLGLGLALVKGLSELHGGSATARSDGPGKGSEFVVSLPLAPPPMPLADEPCPTARPRGMDILVIEDNVDAAHSVAEVLELQGHRVHVATDGHSGIRKARELKPQVILCDIGLPDVDGYAIARTLRADESLRATRLIALSGYAQPEDRRRAREAGFDAHIAKPPSPDALLSSVASGGER